MLAERESGALAAALDTLGARVSSEVAEVEVLRAVRRGAPSLLALAGDVIATLTLLPLDKEIKVRAAEVAPRALRALDAIHLASALSLGESVGALVAYDRRLLEAARDHGLTALAPG